MVLDHREAGIGSADVSLNREVLAVDQYPVQPATTWKFQPPSLNHARDLYELSCTIGIQIKVLPAASAALP